ncbi:MAG TPA: LysM domain-containing protein, partial [Candidatus Bathyarchaeia archaeon]|nr:LysM domain-containing protein [Candidatus Bathyarchaeia archaeon]
GGTAGVPAAGVGAAVGRGRSDSIDDARPVNADQASRPVGDEPPRRLARRSRAYEQHLGGTDGPDWERPRRHEAYPTIKTRVGMPNLSRPALMIGAIAIAAIALFFLPALLGIGGTGSPAASSLAPSGAAASQSLLPTQVPAPTPVLYTIKKNDILSKIASAHGVSLADLLAANPKIKDPNKITEGQVITIPVPSSAPDLGGGSAQPSPSAS